MAYIDRATWGARPPKNAPVAMPAANVARTFVHHGASPVTHGIPAGIQAVRAYQNFHMDSRGWNDIAYSFLVDDDGNVYEGRGWFIVGAHTLNYNSVSHAVCWIGNTEQPSDAALVSINQLISEAAARVGRTLMVQPHSAVYETTCPGDLLRAWLAAGRPTTGAPSAPEPPAVTGSKTLKIGNTGAAVLQVQKRLNAHSVNDARLVVKEDSSFGPQTDAAVRVFQTDVGIGVSGEVDPQTLAALNTAPIHHVPARPTLKEGAKGQDVAFLQQCLNANGAALKVDSDFGPATLLAVQNFQKAHRLVKDGIVGPATWAVLA